MVLTIESWVTALRVPVGEGGYRPCLDHQIRKGDTFCPLGVACDLSRQGKWRGDYYIVNDQKFYIFPPDSVRAVLGLRTISGSYDFMTLPDDLYREIFDYIEGRPGNEFPETLVHLCTWGVPFPVIAKVIEARPEGLFEEEDKI